MSKSNEPDITFPESAHEYNDPDLSPKEFLLAIMRDQRLPVPTRMEAAAKVAVYEHPRLAQTNQDISGGLRIVIEGGLPALPGTDIIMPNLNREPLAKKSNGSG
jgi:hypothetical protein